MENLRLETWAKWLRCKAASGEEGSALCGTCRSQGRRGESRGTTAWRARVRCGEVGDADPGALASPTTEAAWRATFHVPQKLDRLALLHQHVGRRAHDDDDDDDDGDDDMTTRTTMTT